MTLREKIKWIVLDLHTAFVVNVVAYFRSIRDRGYPVCLFRGFKNENERREYIRALEDMESRLSFPIVNKKEHGRPDPH
jgi:hypothetical protein